MQLVVVRGLWQLFGTDEYGFAGSLRSLHKIVFYAVGMDRLKKESWGFLWFRSNRSYP